MFTAGLGASKFVQRNRFLLKQSPTPERLGSYLWQNNKNGR